jgi:putative ABC transport system substrate-binding protein
MRRRQFITLFGAAAAWPFAARAQQAAMPVIGYLDTASASTTARLVAAFHKGLSAAGYDEGRNAPSATTVALLINPSSPAYSEAATESAQSAARVLGMRLLVLNASTPSGIETAFVTLAEDRIRLLLVSGDSFLVAQREQLVALAARHAVPTLYHRREFTAVGGLMSYGPPLTEAYYHVGNYAGRILIKGEKPAHMPVYQSTKFDLVINLKAAKALGIELPPTLLALSDEVIE